MFADGYRLQNIANKWLIAKILILKGEDERIGFASFHLFIVYRIGGN
jgi:hypothetical protein